jgi:hypothetical protein
MMMILLPTFTQDKLKSYGVTMVLVRKPFDELQLQIKLIQCKEDCEHEMVTGDGKLI